MDAVEIVKKISNHYLVENDIAIQMQLGFPYLEKKGDMLYMSFKPHKEVYQKGKIDFYTPQYKIVFVFPFDHVVYFEKFSYKGAFSPEHVTFISDDDMLSIGQYLIDELFDACSRVLTFWEETGTVSDLIVSKYQEQYKRTVGRLNLQEVYL